MSATSWNLANQTTEFGGQNCPPAGAKIVGTPKFGEVCRLLWPRKTAWHLAAIAKRNEKTARRWMDGEFEPPIVVVIAIINKMFER